MNARMMFQVKRLARGYVEWAVLEPDTRKSGRHRLIKWRSKAYGLCPEADLQRALLMFGVKPLLQAVQNRAHGGKSRQTEKAA